MKKIALASLALTLALSSSLVRADPVTSMVIYGNSPQTWEMPAYYSSRAQVPGYAVLTFARQVSFSEGSNTIEVDEIPEGVNANSIMIKKLAAAQQLVEQNFISNDLSVDELINKNIGKEIEVEQITHNGISTIKGILVSDKDGLILKDGSKTLLIKQYADIITKDDSSDKSRQKGGSSIRWVINSGGASNSLFEYSYKTSGITWGANYNVYLDGSGTDMMAKIEGWANLYNSTNIDVKETSLKLVAGQTAQDNRQPVRPMMAMARAVGSEGADAAVSSAAMDEEKFADYHMYTIARKVSMAPQSSKKIKLFEDKQGVLATKKFMYQAGINGDNGIKSVVSFKNDTKSRLGVPLPGGKYRVFAKDSSGEYQELGEVTEPHKSENEVVELPVGNAFDLTAERSQIDSEQDQLRHRGKYTVKVKIRSALEDEVKIAVKEQVQQQNWQILSANFEYKKLDNNQVEFTVKAIPKGETILEYIVDYSW